MVELGFRRAVAGLLLLGRQIIFLLLVAAVGGPVEWSIFCLRYFFSGGRGDGYCFVDDAGVLVVHGQGSVSVFIPFFCGRVGVSCIPLGGWTVWVAEFLGDAGLLFRSLAFWLATAELVFLFCFVKVVYLPAKGMDLICSPVSFFFCVGGTVVGARLLFRSLVSSSVMADRLLLFLDLNDDGRCAWEAVYSASMPGSKSSSAVSSTSWGSRRVAWASCSFGRCASSLTLADSEEVRCPGAMREDPRTLFLNLNGLRVLYANLHLRRMGMTDFIVNFFSSRVLVVKAGLL